MDKEVQKACVYIEKNFKNPGLSPDSICRDLITGKAFLEALFSQELGISVELFITHVRINKARILMEKRPDIDAATAAGETGFTNTGEFCAAFKEITGATFEGYYEEQAGHAR